MDQLRKRSQGYLCGKMLRNVSDDLRFLLPGEAAGNTSARTSAIRMEPNQLVRQHDAQGLTVTSIFRAAPVHQRDKLQRRVPQRRVFEE